MGLGCLIQLSVTLVAYRTSIETAEDAMGMVREERMDLVSLISTMMIPFAAAYSAFGFMTQYAKDALLASDAMLGDLAHQSFLLAVSPIESRRTLIITIAAFVALWLATRGVKFLAEKAHATYLSLLATFLSSCSTFLVLFSVFRVYEQLSFWARDRVFMQWWNDALAWAGSLVRINLPLIVDTGWGWLVSTAWPVFWSVLSQPVLWLAVVALVAGTSLPAIDTVRSAVSSRLGSDYDTKVATVLTAATSERAPGFLRKIVVPFLHLLGVILTAGIPFLCALIVSYTALEWVETWLTYLVNKAIGPVGPKMVLLLGPLQDIVSLALAPCIAAVLLSVAYAQLKQAENQAAMPARTTVPSMDSATSRRMTRSPGSQSRRIGVSVVIVLVSLALAIGMSRLTPPSPDATIEMTMDTPAMVMDSEITLSNVRIGRFLSMSSGFGEPEILFSRGVFVVATVSVYADQNLFSRADLRASSEVYATVEGTGSVSSTPGFVTTRDLVFEVPLSSLDDLVLRATTAQNVTSTVAWGTLRIPPDTPVAREVSASSVVIKEGR
jgi:hypothetical protein